MSIESCASCGMSPVEYTRRLQQIDKENVINPARKNEDTNTKAVAVQAPNVDASRALDIII